MLLCAYHKRQYDLRKAYRIAILSRVEKWHHIAHINRKRKASEKVRNKRRNVLLSVVDPDFSLVPTLTLVVFARFIAGAFSFNAQMITKMLFTK